MKRLVVLSVFIASIAQADIHICKEEAIVMASVVFNSYHREIKFIDEEYDRCHKNAWSDPFQSAPRLTVCEVVRAFKKYLAKKKRGERLEEIRDRYYSCMEEFS